MTSHQKRYILTTLAKMGMAMQGHTGLSVKRRTQLSYRVSCAICDCEVWIARDEEDKEWLVYGDGLYEPCRISQDLDRTGEDARRKQ